MKVTEEQVNRWAQSLSETQNEKCESAVAQITEALRDHFGSSISFLRQGSHRNRTNIRLDSDIDIAVVHNDYFFPDISKLSHSDKILYEADRVPAEYSFSDFKSDVDAVLKNKFGLLFTERRNKCIRVKGNSARVSADVVPAYGHKRFTSYGVVEVEGIGFVTDGRDKVFSFPDHHYDNGVKKNEETSRAFKGVVRILKNVRNKMIEDRRDYSHISSFFIESLVWNVPPEYFNQTTWREAATSVSLKIWDDMRNTAVANNYAEVSDLQWLFQGSQRLYEHAENFMLEAWAYLQVN